jgi:hypothetical protein
VVEGVASYNIVRYEGPFIGIPQSAGPFEVDKADLITIAGIIMAPESAEVRRLIVSSLRRRNKDSENGSAREVVGKAI